MALDPGDYEIDATAVNQPTWTIKVHLDVGKTQVIDVTPEWKVPELGNMTPQMSPTNRKLRTAGFIGIGVGALGLATWGVLGGLAISKNAVSKSHCAADNTCDGEGFRRRMEAISLGHGATAGLIVGGIFAATGISLVVVATAGKKETKRDTGWGLGRSAGTGDEGATRSTNRSNGVVTDVWLGPASFGVQGRW
jgi:hypothetical protein